MQCCWRTDPNGRPTFEELVASISPLLEEVAGYMELSMTLQENKTVEGNDTAAIQTSDTPNSAPTRTMSVLSRDPNDLIVSISKFGHNSQSPESSTTQNMQLPGSVVTEVK